MQSIEGRHERRRSRTSYLTVESKGGGCFFDDDDDDDMMGGLF